MGTLTVTRHPFTLYLPTGNFFQFIHSLYPVFILYNITMAAEVEDMFKKMTMHKGVKGLLIINAEGIPIRSTLDNALQVQYAALIHGFFLQSKNTIREINPQDTLDCIRLRSFKHEIMVFPSQDYLLICIQEPASAV